MNIALLALALGVSCGRIEKPSEAVRFRVDLPPLTGSEQVHLLMQNVTVARNNPVVFRLYAIAPGSPKVYLGSTGVPAISADSAGMTSIDVLRINVSDGVRKWRLAAPEARTIEIEINALGDGGLSIPSLRWSIGGIRLIHPLSPASKP